MERKMGFSSRFEFSSASVPHGCQSTGSSLCCNRYGLDSPARRLDMMAAFGLASAALRNAREARAAGEEARRLLPYCFGPLIMLANHDDALHFRQRGSSIHRQLTDPLQTGL